MKTTIQLIQKFAEANVSGLYKVLNYGMDENTFYISYKDDFGKLQCDKFSILDYITFIFNLKK